MAIESATTLTRALSTLGDDEAVAAVRTGLGDVATRRPTLLVLAAAKPTVIARSLDLVVAAALSHRDALLAREILGRLPRNELERNLGPIVHPMMRDADDDELRRLAELFQHLGLRALLEELCNVAAARPDDASQEVARDFGR